ncbi:hypothetical protein [Bibersteinia trehalosi]|uniref:hypothetical protein n=1 Tax=Bibersteinia trehalosi TaxID=47735 RepID=UPI002D78FD53|nr:hypothetical protein [Bibersteinia trehalosi]
MSNKQKIQEMIEACDQAILDVLSGKTVTFNGRSISRESLSEIRLTRQALKEELAALNKIETGGRHRIKYANLGSRF